MTSCGCAGGKKNYHEFFVFKLSGPLEETPRLAWVIYCFNILVQ